MLTQEQKASIGGESIFTFDGFIGIGGESVIVRMVYEYDSTGIYNETIDTIRTESGFPIMDYLEQSTIDDLCIFGCKLLNESKELEY